MKSFATQILLAIAAILLLMKGGIGIVVALGKFILPLMLLGGAYYFGKKAFVSAKAGNAPLGGGNKEPKVRSSASGVNVKTSEMGGVIEICPHCLSEVGSCAKCRISR